MIILFEPRSSTINNHSQILSTCQNFGQIFKVVKTLDDIPSGTVVFCIDKQATKMLKDDIHVNQLTVFNHLDNFHYVFGPNSGLHLSEIIEGFGRPHKVLTIDSPVNQVFWVEQAIAIILYDKFLKECRNI